VHAIPPGSSYLRAHLSWGFYGDTSAETDLDAVANNLVTMGLVTTVGNGTETPPDPRVGTDVAPPTQRWIYWETRAPVVSATFPGTPGIVTWRDSGATEPTDTKGQVLATGFSSPDTLNLWVVWNSPFLWDSSGSSTFWFGVSILTQTP
jgi:hypothetical protein